MLQNIGLILLQMFPVLVCISTLDSTLDFWSKIFDLTSYSV